MKNKMFKSSFIFIVGRVLMMIIPILTTPIFTRLVSLEDYGQFSLYTTMIGFISIFIGLNTSGSLAIAKIKYGNDYDRYSAHALSVSLVAFLTLTLFTFIFKDFLAKMLELPSNIVLLMIIQSFLGYISGFFGSYLLQKQKILMQFYIGVIGTVVSVPISVYLVINMNDDFLARVLGGLIPAIPFAMLSILYIYTRGRGFIEKEYLKFTFMISLPLVLHLLGHQVLTYIDRIMISKYLNFEEVALYSFGYSAGFVLKTVLSSINTLWAPFYLATKKESPKLVGSYVKKYIALTVFLTIGYLTISTEVVNLLGSGEFLNTKEFVVLIVLSYFVGELYTIPLNVQFYEENTKFVPVGTVLSAVVNIVLNIVLIPTYGIYGAAIATVISYVALFIFHFIISKSLYSTTEVPLLYFLRVMTFVLIYAGIMYIFMDNIFIRWSFGAGYLIYYLYKNQDFIKTLLKREK